MTSKPRQYAAIGPISVFLPERIESNDVLNSDNPRWDMDLISSKTGVLSRHIAADDETSADLGVAACKKLFDEHDVDPASIDFLLFCTQTPDYPLPTSACLMQKELGLPTHCGALDFNLGCSAYPYGLSIADGLIQSGVAKRILFVTGETYSKLIDKHDRSLRTIFGDAATATLIEAHDEPSISGYKFGTDGNGAGLLCVTGGGFRKSVPEFQPAKRRWKSELYMDGPGLVNFTLSEVPGLVQQVLQDAGATEEEVQYYLVHQATFKMLDLLRKQMNTDEQRMPLMFQNVGNTVSSTVPILINQMREKQMFDASKPSVMIGFGVGLSWSACAWQDILGGKPKS